jgi:type VI secretion system protein ImpG
MNDDALEKAFLSELEALEKFRISYSGQHPNAPLAREDPDVRRLIEAMAMFTARTRLAAQRNLGHGLLRVFRQQFPFLTSPMPAMAMLRGVPSRRYVDTTELPTGSEVRVSRPSRSSPTGPDEVFTFKTLAKLVIRPLEIESVDILRAAVRGQGYRLLLRFVAPFPRTEDVGDLRIHVNHLGDLFSSATVYHALKTHVRQASVVYADKVQEDSRGAPCEIRFEAPRGEPDEIELFEHPLQRARAFSQFPEQALFFEVQGIHPPRNWRAFTVCLDVSEAWPVDLRLTPDAFELHAVPMVNVRKDSADPITFDGTKDEHGLVHPERGARFVPHSVLGVFKMSDEGLLPLAPAVLGSGGDGYDVSSSGGGEDRRMSVALSVKGAFDAPVRVVVDALWHQPSIAGARGDSLGVKLGDRFLDGVAWSCLGGVSAPIESALSEDREALLELLAIKSQRLLGVSELSALVHAIGATKSPLFSKVAAAMNGVNVSSKPSARRSSGMKHIYEITFAKLDASDMASLDLFARRLLEVLAAWSVEEIIELVVSVPNLGRVTHLS